MFAGLTAQFPTTTLGRQATYYLCQSHVFRSVREQMCQKRDVLDQWAKFGTNFYQLPEGILLLRQKFTVIIHSRWNTHHL